MTALTVKIDQVAVLRRSRKSQYPDPVAAAILSELGGADGITAHLRKDRRHIQDRDVRILRSVLQTKLILEMASTSEMVGVALDIKPDQVTLVPERRDEFSNDGGLDLIVHQNDISETVSTLQNSGIPTGLLVDTDPEHIKLAHRSGAAMVQIHAGIYNDAKTAPKRQQAFSKIVDAVKLAHRLKFNVQLGRGLGYKTIKAFKQIEEIGEFVIGHSIISRALLTGVTAAVKEMTQLIGG